MVAATAAPAEEPAIGPRVSGAEPPPCLVGARNEQIGEQSERHERGGGKDQEHLALYLPPAARGKKMTRSASRGTSAKVRAIMDSRRPFEPLTGTAAHRPASSCRRNSSTR